MDVLLGSQSLSQPNCINTDSQQWPASDQRGLSIKTLLVGQMDKGNARGEELQNKMAYTRTLLGMSGRISNRLERQATGPPDQYGYMQMSPTPKPSRICRDQQRQHLGHYETLELSMILS